MRVVTKIFTRQRYSIYIYIYICIYIYLYIYNGVIIYIYMRDGGVSDGASCDEDLHEAEIRYISIDR